MTITVTVKQQGLDSLTKSLAEVVALQRQISQTGRGLTGVGQSVSRAGQAARGATANFREFSQSVSGVTPAAQSVSDRLSALRIANTQLARSIGVPIGQIQRLNSNLGTLTPVTSRIVERFATFRDAGSSVERTFRQLNEEFGLTREQFNQLSSAVGASEQTLAAVAVAAGGLAQQISGIFAQGFSDFIAFDSTLQSIAAISGETREELSALEEEIVSLGSTTQFSNQQIAVAARDLLRLGFSADEVETALSGIVDGARASGESLETVSRIVATTINQFEELEPASATAISDVLAAAANNSATNVSGLGEALSFVGTEANSLGQSVEDTVTVLGLLADGGLRAGRGGRNLASALSRLRAAAGANTADFQKLGVSLTDINGEFVPLLDLIPQIRANLDELGDPVAEGALLNRLFGAEGARAFRILLSQSEDSIEDLRGTINNAAGSAAAAGDTLTAGLGGALTQLGSASETASATIGSVFAPAAEAAVEAATSLVQAFNALPGPIQASLVATTAFVGVLAAAVSTVAAYTAANRLLNLEQTRLALQTITATVAINADTVAKAANTLATTNLVVVARALPAVLAAQAAGFSASAASAGAFIATLAPLAGILAAVTGAFIVWQEAISRTSDAGNTLREGNNDVVESLDALGSEAEAAANALERIENTDPVPEGIVDGLLDGLTKIVNRITDLINFIPLIPNIPDLATNAEKRVNDLRVAITESREEANLLADASIELGQTISQGFENSTEGIAEYEAAVAKAAEIQSIFDAELADQRRQLAVLDGDTLGSEAYEELSNSIQGNIDFLIRQREVLQGQVDAANAASQGIEEVGDSVALTANEVEDLVEALEEQRDELRQTAEEEFRVSAEADTDRFRDQQRTEDRAFQRELQNSERAFESQLAAEKEQAEAEIQQLERTFSEQERNEERAFTRELQQQESAFSDGQQRNQEAFNQRQQDARRQFESEINEIRQQGEEEIAGLRQDVERTIQLEEADTPQERDELEERFAEEDRLAERRAELLEPILQREAEIAEEIQQKELAFEKQQRAEALAFEAVQEQQKEAFELKLQQLRDTNERAIEDRRLTFEEGLAQRRDELEQAQEGRRDSFETSLEQRRDAFRTAQEAAQDAFEERQRQREAAFNEQQRELDRQSAADIEAIQAGANQANEIREILERTDIPSVERAQVVKEILESVQVPVLESVPGFREGGVTDGGIARVGEAGPEYAVFPKGTRILNKSDSQRAVVNAIKAKQSTQSAVRPVPGVSTPRIPTPPLIQGVQPNNARMEGLLTASVGAMERMNSTESRVFSEVNRMRRSQERNAATISQARKTGLNPKIDEAMTLLLGGIL